MPTTVPEFRIVVFGERVVAESLTEMGNRAVNPRPALEEIYLTILDIVDEIFENEGARGGRLKWAPLTPGWLYRKVKRGEDPRILHEDGDLRQSVTRFRDGNQTIRIERDKIIFGSKLPYARRQFRGDSHFHDNRLGPGRRGVMQGGFTRDHLGQIVSSGQEVALGSGIPPRPFVFFTASDSAAFGREIARYVMKAFK